MSTLDVLRGARELLVTEGWTQGHFSRQGCYCAAGACNKAATGWASVKRQESADAQTAVERAAGLLPGQLTYWNDRRIRTVDEVLAAFDRAIADCVKARVHLVEAGQAIAAGRGGR